MSKWRAIQHRHRYTYNAVIFPPHFFEALNQTPSTRFFTELKHLISLKSTYSQLTHAKNIASAFTDMLSNPNRDVGPISLASKLYMEIIFLENSVPLHRTLVSGFSKARSFQDLIVGCFRELCEDYGGENGKGKRFSVCRVALSLMGTPKLGYMSEVVEECALLVGLDVISGLNSVLLEVGGFSRPSPLVMEQCQDALSCSYYLLQRYPKKFCAGNGGNSDILETMLTTILNIMNSEGFSRDCFVAAGVSLCAALQVCLSPEELGLFLMEGVFNHTPIVNGSISLDGVLGRIPFKGKVMDEIHRFSTLSRLCFIRGILTAVSREVLNSPFVVLNGLYEADIASSGDGRRWILYDGMLPELCNYCENPIDSHFNFHALTVMQICLQQIKTSIQCNVGENTDDYDLISESMAARILRIMWNNLEDPLSQTVKQVHLIFDLFLDIQGSRHLAEGSEKIKSFLGGIASDLLRLGPRCKGRYIPLALLTKRLGAKAILLMKPDLLFETTEGYIDDDVCSAATNFLKCFLESLRDEYWNSDGVENGYMKYRGQCLPPFLDGLSSGVPKLRTNLNTYALPVLLGLDEDSIFSLLASLGIRLAEGASEIVYPEFRSLNESAAAEHQVAVLVSLLKVARALALIEGDLDWYGSFSSFSEKLLMNTENDDSYALVYIKAIKVKIPVRWLLLALTHTDDSLRIDAAETLFLNPKSASLPSSLELRLMRDAVPLNMRCSSTAFQMKWSSLFRKFFSRVRIALEKQLKLGNWQPLLSGNHTTVLSSNEAEEVIGERAQDVFNFMRRLSCFLFLSCYPSAPYERKIMAMELILIMLSVWPMMNPFQGNGNLFSPNISLDPYGSWFTLPESALLLVGSIVDSWDRLRENSFQILLHFPTPLPGIHSPDMVEQAIIWAKRLVCSPRVRESDAGALTLRLIFRKYVVDLGWIVRPCSNSVSFHSQPELSNGNHPDITQCSPVMEYIRSLIDWLLLAVEEGEKDLSEACTDSFVHGVLLTLRYTFEELDWSSDVVLSSAVAMKLALNKLLDLVMRITSLALWVVAADAYHLPDEMEDENDAFTLEVAVETGAAALIHDDEVKTMENVRDVRSSEQIVMVGCWLAMKEVSLLLGTIIRKIPLPTSDASDLRIQDIEKDCASSVASGAMLDLKQLQIIGNHFLEVMLKMKHSGAIDKTRAGFTALCNRLLSSDDSRLCKLTESWMEQLMERMVAQGQTVDDLLRRSAGIPAAFSAFFLSEPEGTPKRLLPRALRWLIDIAKKPLADQEEENSSGAEICSFNSTNSSEVDKLEPILVSDHENISKIRDEGVVPTVHAFNVLRVTFNDTNLATDTSGFSAEAMIISIRSFSSPYWEVRNGACLAYTALVRRMIGFLNVQKRESVKRALTGLEFFHRYPLLHAFLLDELRVATEMLTKGSSEHPGANLKNDVHPSLCPMLILLSRLKPSAIANDAGDMLDPALFMPFIRRCTIQSNYRIRVLASRALTGLVSNEKLPLLLLNIISEIPSEEDMASGRCSYNSIHGMLLQLNALLDTNCRNLADSGKKDTILGDLTDVLVSRTWIGRPHKCACPILNTCLLQVLDNMLSISKACKLTKCTSAIRKILLELSSECLDTGRLLGPSYYDPTIPELRRQAATSFFNCIWQSPKELTVEDVTSKTEASALYLSKASGMDVSSSKLKEKLLGCMSDVSYEVRIAALKWLFSFLKKTKPVGDNSGPKYEMVKVFCANMDLQSILTKLLSEEKNNKCTYYILKNLYSWNVLCQLDGQHTSETRFVENMNHDSVFQFWDELVSLYQITRHSKTRQSLLCCLGVCMKRISGIFLSSICLDNTSDQSTEYTHSDCEMKISLYERINYFVNVIKEHGNAAETVNMRRASAESIVASGLLGQAQFLGILVSDINVPHQKLYSQFSEKEAINMYAHRVLDLWLISIKLLEDEDEELRRQLALDMQRLIVLKDSKIGSPTEVVPSQVEKVIEMSVAHLSSIFGHWVDYIEFLCHWILSAANSANYDASIGDLVRLVFDKEIDNHHEEKLLICEICCFHLEKLPLTKTSAAGFCDRGQIRNFLSGWRERFCRQLKKFVINHARELGDGIDWIGGVGNHKDAFLPLYANLLAVYALSNCLSHGQETENGDHNSLSELTELGQIIHPYLRNPQIGNLYKLLVKSHENVFGSVAQHLTANSSADFCVWDEFDPYFLLR